MAAATAHLPSPRATAAPSTTMKSPPNSSSTNNRLTAAADLIRNLDAALSGMTAAATSAAEDAARARRNAKAAGEVARRYGGSSTNKKKKGERNINGESSSLLERKRERRAATRMAAEARQRREHPMPCASPRKTTTPRSSRGGTFSFAVEGGEVAMAGSAVNYETVHDNRGIAATANSHLARQVHLDAKPATTTNDAVTTVNNGAVPTSNSESNQRSALNQIPAKTNGIITSNTDEFEDAMEHHHDGIMGVDSLRQAEQTNDGQPQMLEEYVDQQQPRMMEGEYGQEEELSQPLLQNDYQDQTSYYNNQQQGQQQQHSYYQSKQEVVDQGQQDAEYYNQNQNQQYYNQPVADPSSLEQPQQQPQTQSTTTTRIEASHAEDVLTLSLELERVRSQLATTTQQLSNVSNLSTSLQVQNDHLNVELTTLHSQLETHDERSATQLSSLQQLYDAEQCKSKAAEEDAALALELAKEAQLAKEECEMWLTRSLEEIDLWKGRCSANAQKEGQEEDEEEPKKLVRFKEDCPPSPVISEDGRFGHEVVNTVASPTIHAAVNHAATPPPPTLSTSSEWSTPQSASTNNDVSTNNSHTTNTGTPSKSDIASGRAFLHRATAASPSPLKQDGTSVANIVGTAISPHPRMQASELLKKSAETRRLLRERLAPGHHTLHHGGSMRPPMMALANANKKMISRTLSDPSLNDNFASRQGAACKAVGRTIRESGIRLRLNGKWWVGGDPSSSLLLTNGSSSGGSSGTTNTTDGTVAQLESMVRDYCGSVEGKVGQQREKIDGLLAFCDHLEKEVMTVNN